VTIHDPLEATLANVKLFSARACPFAHRTRLVLSHKKIDFELVEIDLQNKPSWFGTVSAYGKVPAIEHAGNRIWESAVINEYLDEVFRSPALLPEEPALRAVARIWVDWANTRLVPAFGALLRGQTPAEQATGRRDLGESVTYLEREGLARHGGDGPFFFGSRPGLVDFALYPWFERWAALEHYRGFAVPKDLARLARWTNEAGKLDAVQAHANPSEYYIERYARYASPAKQAVVS
jgi:glutathione S-transferase